MSEKADWLFKRGNAVASLRDKVLNEQYLLNNSGFGYVGGYHNAIEELGLALHFLNQELKDEMSRNPAPAPKQLYVPQMACKVIDHRPDLLPIPPPPKDRATWQEDLTGMVFGDMTVIGPNDTKPLRWMCQCKCGVVEPRRAKTVKKSVDDKCELCQKAESGE